MKVAELRKALEGVDDELDIVVRAWDDDGSDYTGTIGLAHVEHGCDDLPFFAIECDEDDAQGLPRLARSDGGAES